MNKLEHLYTEAFNNITQIINFYFSTQEEPNNYIPKEVITDEKLIYDLIKTHFKQSTLEEVKKEWEALGYIWVEQRKKAQLEIHLLNTVSEIIIYTSTKMYECIDREIDIVAHPLTYQAHNLLSKTLKALEVNNNE